MGVNVSPDTMPLCKTDYDDDITYLASKSSCEVCEAFFLGDMGVAQKIQLLLVERSIHP